MIQRKDLLAFPYYKKKEFTGSYCGMRYLIRREQEGEETLFFVYTWPGPYNFAFTPEEKKTKRRFPFTEQSLEKIAEYLNCTYQEREGKWPSSW